MIDHSTLSPHSLLGIENLSASTIQSVLDRALEFKTADKSQPLAQFLDKTVCLLFFEPSTRTRGSFEVATNKLGAKCLVLTKSMSSSEKGETLLDTAKTIQAMAPDVLVLRHSSAGSPYHLSRKLKIPIVNAGDGFHEHPTQAFLDLMTIIEFKKRLQDLKVLIVGDIAHSRVARSNIYALKTMGAKVSLCGPQTLLPPKVEQLGVKVFTDLEKAVVDQQVIIGLRIQKERLEGVQIPSLGEYSRFYSISKKILSLCPKDVLIMHPGPMNRGIEVQPEVADGPNSVILNQVENGVFVRMAVLERSLKKETFE